MAKRTQAGLRIEAQCSTVEQVLFEAFLFAGGQIAFHNHSIGEHELLLVGCLPVTETLRFWRVFEEMFWKLIRFKMFK